MHTEDELVSLKRPQLQKICKQLGIKAAGKNAELIESILAHQSSGDAIADSGEKQDQQHHEESKESEEIVNEQEENNVVLENVVVPQQIEESISEQAVEPAAPLLPQDSREESASNSTVTEKPTASSTKKAPMTPKARLDRIHQKSFNKMSSITTHYAAHRPVTPVKSNIPVPKPIQKPVVARVPRKSISAPTNITSTGQKRKRTSENELVLSVNVVSTANKKTKRDSIASQSARRESLRSATQAALSAVAHLQPTKPIKMKPTASTSAASKTKPKFDLKASLKRPLNYKPYTGSLKPVAPLNSTSKQ